MTDSPKDNFTCSYCGTPNAIKPEMLKKIQVRCGGCKLYLKNQKHIKYKHLEPAVFRHPLEQPLLDKMEKTPGTPIVIQKLADCINEDLLKSYFRASGIRVTEKQHKDLLAKVKMICWTLNISVLPEIFICNEGLSGPLGLQALIYGSKKPFIVISPLALEVFDQIELVILLAHELSFLYSSQMPLKMASEFLMLDTQHIISRKILATTVNNMNVTQQKALTQWRYKSRLSADRAALLVSQDGQAMLNYFIKLSGGGSVGHITPGAFRSQLIEFDESFGEDWFEKNWSIFGLMPQSTLAVWRASELVKWGEKARGFKEIVKVFGS